MNDDLRRRRRLTPSGPRRPRNSSGSNAWIVTGVAALAVIVGGWFLGQGLAHWLSPGSERVARQPSPLPLATSIESPTMEPQPTAAASPTLPPETPAPTRVPTPRTTHRPTLPPTAPPTLAPTAAPTPTPTLVPTPAATAAPSASSQARTTLPVARRPQPSSPPAAAAAPASGAAAQTVRSYIDALRRGDPQSAATYLGNGSPDEAFIDANTEIYSVSSARNGDGSYTVTAHLHTPKGAYTETFTVAPTSGGSKILDKSFSGPPR